LAKNIEVFLEEIEKSTPTSLKGKLIFGISLCSTMGAGIKIDWEKK